MAIGNLEKAHTEDEAPSAEFGWSGESSKGFTVAGLIVVGCLLSMLIGNHIGHVEDIFIFFFAGMILWLLTWEHIKHKVFKQQ